MVEPIPHTGSRCQEDPVRAALAAGHAALLVTGNIYDFSIVDNEVVYRPQHLAELLCERGFIVIRYARSQGGRISNYASFTPKEKESVDSRLNALEFSRLLNRDGQSSPEEIRAFFRAVARLLQIPAKGTKPFAVIIEYAEHVAPAVQTAAVAADEHTFVSEVLHTLANAPAMRKSGNILICLARDGFYHSLLNDLHRVELPFPDESQTQAFISSVLTRRDTQGVCPYGTLDTEFSQQEFARLARGLRLRDVEGMLREACFRNIPLARKQVLDAKASATLRDSEGTLSVMETSLTLDDIVGLQVAKRFFRLIAEKLKTGDPTSPRAILMVGPPGTAKSTFAPLLAELCGFNVLQFQTVKNLFVGESERRLNLALSLVESLSPTVLFIDEITETTPSRNTSVNDGGVSLDLLAQLFKFSARDDLRGKVLLLGASNVPERLDPAWHDRFIIVPFLELLSQEMCELFGMFQQRVTGKVTLNPHDPKLIEAAQVLHQKGASPRKVLDIVNHALLNSSSDTLSSDDILSAATDYVGSANPMAVAYTSLIAISLTSFHSYLPWSLDPEHYVYPWYLEGIVNKSNGSVDRESLHKRIQEYHPYTNL